MHIWAGSTYHNLKHSFTSIHVKGFTIKMSNQTEPKDSTCQNCFYFILIISLALLLSTHQVISEFYDPSSYHISSRITAYTYEEDQILSQLADEKIKDLRLKLVFLQDDCKHTLYDLRLKFRDLSHEHEALEEERLEESDFGDDEKIKDFTERADYLIGNLTGYRRTRMDTGEGLGIEKFNKMAKKDCKNGIFFYES